MPELRHRAADWRSDWPQGLGLWGGEHVTVIGFLQSNERRGRRKSGDKEDWRKGWWRRRRGRKRMKRRNGRGW